jgi:Holliday junction DNA helicase RuvA
MQSMYDAGMIGHVKGNVIAIGAGFVIISAGGVGYKVAVTKETLIKQREGGKAALWTHLAVREAVLDLYGFLHKEELKFFELLLTVSGIGPKSALAILDIANVDTLRNAISGSNASYLTKVSGIGRKTAEKIVLELRDKVGASEEGSARMLHGEEEALQAMRALGYSQGEARDALRKVSPEIEKSGDRLREALKILGGKQ